MGHEGFNAAEAQLIYENGELNEQLLAERYGLSPEDAAQEVTFGTYTGTVAQMLSDERCPVGSMVETAYAESGIEGVSEKFKTLAQLDPRFTVEISEQTLEREHLKKN
jgi:hypothetical protein